MESVELLSALDRYGFYFFQCLISFLWQSSFILVPVLASLWLLRKHNPAIRNAVALSGFVAVSIILACSWFQRVPQVPSYPLPVMPDYRALDNPVPLPGLNADPGVSMTRTAIPRELTAVSGSGNRHPRSAVSPDKGTRTSLFREMRAYPWALGLLLYLLVQAYLILKLFLEWYIVRWWIWRSRTVDEFEFCRPFWNAAFFLDLRISQFKIMESPILPVPVTVGAIHPRIIIPAGFRDRCTPEDFRAVVYHELAHVRRRDPLVITGISLLRTLLFFHPLVQLAVREFTLISEQSSDKAAIEESGVSAKSYARSLNRVVEMLSQEALKPTLALGVYRRQSFYFHRIELILSASKGIQLPYRPLFSAIAVASFALFVAAAFSLPLVEHNPGSVETITLENTPDLPLASLAPPHAACAIPVRDIRIDGSLDDWPKGMIRYPISNTVSSSPAPGGDRSVDSGSGSRMMVGYNPDDNFLYVAVTVPDNRLVVVRDPEYASPERTDACEVYVDGMHLAQKAAESFESCSAWDLPAQQYVMCPDGGAYDRTAWLYSPPYTPALFRGNIHNTGSRCVASRHEGFTVYEWAVRVYSRYPKEPVRLASGNVIGFDVLVRNTDRPLGPSTWAAWGQPSLSKAFDTSLLGDLVLVDRYEDLGFVSGTLTRCHEPCPNRTLYVYRDNSWIGEYSTDRNGQFHLMLPPGNYTVRPGHSSTQDRLCLDAFSVSPGTLVKPRFRIPMNGFSRLRYETAEMLRTVRDILS